MEEDIPIAVRRTRRSSVGPQQQLPSESIQCDTTFKTPRKVKKAVRFSDIGPSSTSSGLTPFIRRTALTTPKRRASTPARRSSYGSSTPSSKNSAQLFSSAASHSLHQTTDGRVQRRQRRNGMRDLINKLEQDQKRKVQASREEVQQLKAELKARDREIYELQNATIEVDTDRLWDLEQQVEDLQSELEKRTSDNSNGTQHGQGEVEMDQTRSYDWTMAARDPFNDDFMDLIPDEDEHFGDATVAQFACSTPTRGARASASASFPTPPATSPTVPLTPCSHHNKRKNTIMIPPVSHSAGVQVCFEDPSKKILEEELASLQLEVAKLTATLDSYKGLAGRISDHVAPILNSSVNEDVSESSTHALEEQIKSLVQVMSDRTAALAHLTTTITTLGFPGTDASEMLASLSSGFRAARLELEYLTPGEITLPLSSHGAEVLDLLLSRLRDLAKRAKEDETSIDEYHELESSLRKQLDARVSAMDALAGEMAKAEALVAEKSGRVAELEVANERLRGAVNGYIRDIGELERLVERMEKEGQDAASENDTYRVDASSALTKKDEAILELETKLSDLQTHSATLQSEMSKLQDSQTRHVATLNQRHGKALALRDARVSELREEVERVNTSLRTAHETVRKLRVEQGKMEGKLEDQKQRAKAAIESVKEELQRALEMSRRSLDSPSRRAGAVAVVTGLREVGGGAGMTASGSSKRGSSEGVGDGDGVPSSPLKRGSEVGAGGFLSGDLARRVSKKMRRRYDSGLGFLDEDDVDI